MCVCVCVCERVFLPPPLKMQSAVGLSQDVFGQSEHRKKDFGGGHVHCDMCYGNIMNYIIITIPAREKGDKTDI